MKVGLFVTHPVQYHACLWRGLAERSDLDARVYFFSKQGVEETVDPDFGTEVVWDEPLLEGYDSEFLGNDPIGRVARSTIPACDQLLSRESFDVVFLHGYTHAFGRQLLRRKSKYGYRVVLRGEFSDAREGESPPWKRILREQYLRWFYRRVDHFCPIGVDAVKHLEQREVPGERMTVTPYSVDDALIDRQREAWKREDARAELGLDPDQVLFLFSGKLIPRKQPLLLAEAATRLADERRFAVAFLGSGEQEELVRERLAPLLGSRFIAPGFVNQSELGLYFSAADVFVLPSAFDTWGLVVNEAMHWGLPCIVSDRTGCRHDLVVPGETGFVHRWNDVSDLERCMRKFLEQPERATDFGKAAHRRIESFRSGQVVDALARAFREAADAPLR